MDFPAQKVQSKGQPRLVTTGAIGHAFAELKMGAIL
jgi:hypothetical protein